MNHSKIKATFLFLFVAHSFFTNAQNNFSLHDLNWLKGSWVNSDSTLIEKWVSDNEHSFTGEVVNFETQATLEKLQLVLEDGNIVYRALPKQNSEWTDFLLTSADLKTWTFENPNHDFPTKITYKKINNNKIIITIQSSERSLAFKYLRL